MANNEQENHVYLGDGVYAQWDGDHFILRTDSHLDCECRDKIYLEPEVLTRLCKFAVMQTDINLTGK